MVLRDAHCQLGGASDARGAHRERRDPIGLEPSAERRPQELPPITMGRDSGENGPITGAVALPIRSVHDKTPIVEFEGNRKPGCCDLDNQA